MEKRERWRLAELIEFESALASWDGVAERQRGGKCGRAEVFRRWLRGRGESGVGRQLVGGLDGAAWVLGLVALSAGGGAVWGSLDRSLGGVHVIWLLAGALFLPWLAFLGGAGVWLLRGRVAGLGALGWVVEKLGAALSTTKAKEAWEGVRRNRELFRVVGWRVARRSQQVAATFHLGAVLGLAAMVLFKRVGFFWETTTERAMEGFLERAVEVLSMPWLWVWAEGVPEVEATRRTAEWSGGGESWWPFLIAALVVWGVVPRLAMAGFAGWRERRALATLDFQAPQHRKLWRALTAVTRGEEPRGPVDGALVIALGGAVPEPEALRPFLLRRLRMNPTGWESLGVLDEGREEAAREALEKAPAGVVLLAEGWSLAPRQFERALAEVKKRAAERRVVVAVGNPDTAGNWQPPEDEERRQWERFVDEKAADEVELVFLGPI